MDANTFNVNLIPETMDINWTLADYDDIDVPTPLYKFREWKDTRHKTILTDRLVYLSPPSGFEDPLDCKIPVRYNLMSHRDLNKLFFNTSVKRHPNWSKSQHKKWSKKWMKQSPIRNPKKYNHLEKKFAIELDKILGVLCLTPIVENLELWKKYSDNHKGFCVGFDGKGLLGDFEKFGASGTVEYFEKLPLIRHDEDEKTKIFKQTFSKLTKWSFEKEFRTTKLKPYEALGEVWRKVLVPDNRFVEIIFGALIPEDDKLEITQFVKKRMPHVKLRQAEIDLDKKTITVKDLP
jgi:Protein of unknown function (DUF2971)